MRLERNVVFSLILILAALDNLFNPILFLAAILFIIMVTGHYHLSLILCLPPPGVITQPRLLSPTFGRHCPPPAVIAHPQQPSPPAVFFIFVDMFPAIFFQIPAVSVPPAVLTFTLLYSHAPHSPLHNPGRPPISPAICLNGRMCLTIFRKA